MWNQAQLSRVINGGLVVETLRGIASHSPQPAQGRTGVSRWTILDRSIRLLIPGRRIRSPAVQCNYTLAEPIAQLKRNVNIQLTLGICPGIRTVEPAEIPGQFPSQTESLGRIGIKITIVSEYRKIQTVGFDILIHVIAVDFL